MIPLNIPLYDLPLTQLGNAERLVARYGPDLRYCSALGWLVFDGARWRRDDTGQVERFAKATARLINEEAAQVMERAAKEEDPTRRESLQQQAKALLAHAKRSEALKETDALVKHARSEPGIPIRVEELDTDPYRFNVSNGTLDLRTGTLSDHRREDLLTKQSPVAFDPQESAPTWDAFLERVLPDPAVRAYVQRLVGQALIGKVYEQVLPFLYGEGRNGKSTFVRAVMSTFGDYAEQASGELLLMKPAGGVPADVAMLRGARLVATIEVDDGRRLAEGLVKQLSGGDKITARFMRQDFFCFDPTFTLLLVANHRPEVRGEDFAIWRRIKVVPFTETICEAEVDPQIPDKLGAEAPGILNWLLAGCLAWQKEGLLEPEAVRLGTQAYRDASDILGRFVEDCCVLSPAAKVGASALYQQYRTWCEENGHRALSATKFGERMNARAGVERVHLRTGKWYLGIGLADEVGQEGDGCDGCDGTSGFSSRESGFYSDNRAKPSHPSPSSQKVRVTL